MLVAEIDSVRQQLRLAESAGYISARPAWPREPGLHPQGRHQRVSARQQYRVDSAGHTRSGELRGLPSTAARQQSTDGSVGSERPRNRKVADQSGLRPRSACQRHASHAVRGTSISTPVRRATAIMPKSSRSSPCPFRSRTPPTRRAGSRITGYFNLVSVRTTEMAKFGSDLTPGGRARVHQELPGSNLYFY